MRIIIDLDGIICPLKLPNQSYQELKPNRKVITLLKRLKREGHFIIISTSRHMRTCNDNVEEVVLKIGKITTDWLRKFDVPYSEIYFGKPHGDIYIDDLALPYQSPEDLEKNLKSLMPNFVIPMAGQGKRFLEAGYNIPKYIIKAHKKSMFEWALASLPLDMAQKVIFIYFKEHQKKYNVSKFIRDVVITDYPFLKNRYLIIWLNKVTRGQTETVLSAKKYINNEIPLVIYNIDSYFQSSRLRQRLFNVYYQGIDGVLGVFRSRGHRWSFIKVNKNGFVIKTTEKKPISNLASTGLYTFTKGKDFVKAAEYAVKNNLTIKGEFYIAPLYNILIKERKRFIVDFAEEFWCLGTPKDLNNFLKKIC